MASASAGGTLGSTAISKAASTGELCAKGQGTQASIGASTDLAASQRLRRRKPGAQWDGRVSNLSLKEFRERKWGLDAAFAKTQRGGPSYTLRPSVPLKIAAATNTILPVDPVAAFHATKPKDPSFSMGAAPITHPKETTKGPGNYKIPNSFDRKGNPLYTKHTGPKFGSERLTVTEDNTPAPGDYDVNHSFVHLARIKSSPKYTAAGREAWMDRTSPPNPGPGEYAFQHCMRTGKATPLSWTAQGKTLPLEKPRGSRMYILPGPPHYKPPGAGADTNSTREKAPNYRFSSEPRGL